MKNDYYVYVYLNQTKKGKWEFKNHTLNYQPFYVGKGRGSREIEHLCQYSLKKKNFKNSIIKSIIRKTNEQPLHYRIFENLSNEEAIKIEKDFIKTFGRLDNKTGILSNGTDGGDGANNFSETTLKKIGKKRKVYQYDLEGNFIKEWESISLINIPNSSNICTAIKRNGTFGGYMWSYNFVDKLQPKIIYQMPIKYKNIQQIDIETNKVIKTYPSALDVEKELGISGARERIYQCIKKSKTAYGYKWKEGK